MKKLLIAFLLLGLISCNEESELTMCNPCIVESVRRTDYGYNLKVVGQYITAPQNSSNFFIVTPNKYGIGDTIKY